MGLAAWLLGIENTTQIATHPLRGPLFENLAIAEVIKHRYNTVRTSNLSFYRDSSGLEVDLIHPLGNRLLPIEIKVGQTVTSSQIESLEKFTRLFPSQTASPLLVHGGREEIPRGAIRAIPVRALVPRIRTLELTA